MTVGLEHEAWRDFFKLWPEHAAPLLTEVLGVPMPPHVSTRPGPSDMSQVLTFEMRSDAVIVLVDATGRDVQAVMIEVQRGRDQDKRSVWPLYLMALWEHLRCPVMLLVVCPDSSLVQWCGRPFEPGHPGVVFRPLVVGPDQIPIIVDAESAMSAPAIAVLSAMAHGDGPDGDAVLAAMFEGLEKVPEVTMGRYIDMVTAALPNQAVQVEKLMQTYKYKSELFLEQQRIGEARGEERGEARGMARGEAEAILRVLTARNIHVSPQIDRRIRQCSDKSLLDRWLERAITATTADELFA